MSPLFLKALSDERPRVGSAIGVQVRKSSVLHHGVGPSFHGVGFRLRRVQTGFIRNYVLFLALAAIAIFAVLTYFINMASASP